VTKLRWIVLALCLVFLSACEALYDRGLADQFKRAIDNMEHLTEEQKAAGHAAIDAGTQSWTWEQVVATLLGLGGVIVGGGAGVAASRAQRAVAERGPAKPLSAQQIAALEKILAKEQAG